MQQGVEPETDTAAPTADTASRSKPQSKEIDYDSAAKALVDKCVKDAANNTARLERDKTDWRNLLFDRGGPDNQYLIWDAGTNRYVTRGTDPKKGGLPEWMPRPVTNLYATKCDGITSILNQSQPGQNWKPNTDDDEDLATADVCDDALPVLLDEIEWDSLRTDVHRQITLTDKVAIIIDYDNDEKHGVEPILAQQCPTCAADPAAEESYFLPMDLPEDAPDTCPNCEGPLDVALDPQTNQPIGVDYPIGKMVASFHPSFEFSLPSSARSHRVEKNPWILFHFRDSWENAIREHPEKAEQLKNKAGWKDSSLQRQYADAMRRISSPSAAREKLGGAPDGPVFYKLYHDPIDDGEFYFPDGLYAIVAGDVLIKAGPLSFHSRLSNGQERAFKNVVTRTFRPTPGSQYGKPPADDLVPLQYTRNLLEALLLSILLHHASPRTYLPLSVTLEKNPTGAPGEVIPFRSTTPGEVPITAQGLNPPDGIYKYIEIIDQKADEISKLNAVLQGERPPGDPTLGEIEILKERGESAFAEPIAELVRFERQVCRMLLWIARDTLWSDRLQQIQGENKAWEVTQFNQADLQGNVDVQIDTANAWPKSPMMQRAQLMEAIKVGVFQLMQVDPELATEMLEFYGLERFKPSLDVDRMQIRRKLDRWKAARSPAEIAPPDEVVENLQLHAQHCLNFLKTEEVEAIAKQNPPLYQAMRNHVQQIQQLLAMRAAAAAMAKAGGPPAGNDTNKPPSGETLDHAVKTGALQPAGASGLSLESAMQQGLLQPAGATDAAAQAAGPSIDDLTASGALIPADAANATAGATGMPGV